VHLLGRLGDADVAAMLGAADVALVPSRYEPFGLVALEAMAAGTPVVVSDTGGLRDIVSDGTTGLMVPPGEPAALAEAVASLLGDRARRDEMGRAGAARVGTRFGWDAVAAATGRVYDSAVG
jgi:glycogen(starch) synthase